MATGLPGDEFGEQFFDPRDLVVAPQDAQRPDARRRALAGGALGAEFFVRQRGEVLIVDVALCSWMRSINPS